MTCVSRYHEARNSSTIAPTPQQNKRTGSVRVTGSMPSVVDSRKIIPLLTAIPADSESKSATSQISWSGPVAGWRNAALKTAHKESKHITSAIGLTSSTSNPAFLAPPV
jgi:hypothetical protein